MRAALFQCGVDEAALEKEQVVASELGGRDPIEARTRVLAERVNDLNVATAGGRAQSRRTTRRAGSAVAWSQTPPVTEPTPLGVTRLPVGRRATASVQVA